MSSRDPTGLCQHPGSFSRLIFYPHRLLGLFKRSVTSDSWRPHGLQHTRLPCPSPSPGVWQSLQMALGDSIITRKKKKIRSLPRESHGQRSLVGYSPRGRKELDTTEQTLTHSLLHCRQILYRLSKRENPSYLLYRVAKYRGTQSKTVPKRAEIGGLLKRLVTPLLVQMGPLSKTPRLCPNSASR